MRSIVLTAYPDLYTPRRLLEAGRRLGMEIEILTPARAPGRAPAGALVLARPGTFRWIPILRAQQRLVELGAVALNARRALLDAGDQWRTILRLRRHGIRVPPSILVRAAAALPAALDQVVGPPWFLKGRRGSQGTHVLLGADRRGAMRAGHLFWGCGQSFLVQQDLRPTGRVERHLVAAGVVIASGIARAAAGEHRTNVHRGGHVVAIDPGAGFGAGIALRAVERLRLAFAAVDTIGEADPAVLDVNASPGLRSLERATRRDLAAEVLERLAPIARLDRTEPARQSHPALAGADRGAMAPRFPRVADSRRPEVPER